MRGEGKEKYVLVAWGVVTVMVGPGHRAWPFKEMSPHSLFFFFLSMIVVLDF